MRELSSLELDTVSGGTIGSDIGNALIGFSNVANTLADAAAPVVYYGTLLVAPIHQAVDAFFYGTSKLLVGIGQSLGGTLAPDYHYENEWVNHTVV